MSWSSTGPALSVPGGTEPDAKSTSQSPLLLTDSLGYLVRLYGVSTGALRDASKVIVDEVVVSVTDFPLSFCDPTIASSWSRRHAVTNIRSNIVYCDSAPFGTGTFPHTIQIDIKATTTELFNTCIPAIIKGVMVALSCNSTATTGDTVTRLSTKFILNYRDPQVIALPGNDGYLMVMGSYLYEEKDDPPDNNNSRTQVVAWWSDDASFTGASVVGPFVLVDSMQCWLDAQTVRMWVGVPGAALTRANDGVQYLYVYYVVEETAKAYGGDCGKSDRLDAGLEDGISQGAYDTAFGALGPFKPGVACKRIKWSTFRSMIKKELRDGPTNLPNDLRWDVRDVVPGDLLGLIRVWLQSGPATDDYGFHTAVLPVQDFFDAYRKEGSTMDTVRYAAPHPMTCGLDPSQLSLYLAMTIADKSGTDFEPDGPSAAGPGTGHGIWRGRALPYSRWLQDADGLIIKSTLGRDFVVAPLDADNRSADMVAASDGTTLYIDPGAVQLDDSSWWVISGVQDIGLEKTTALTGFAGTRADGCESWRILYADGIHPADSTASKILPQPDAVHL